VLLEAQVPAPLSIVTVCPVRVVSQTTESPTATVVVGGVKVKPVPLETVKVAAWDGADAKKPIASRTDRENVSNPVRPGFGEWVFVMGYWTVRIPVIPVQVASQVPDPQEWKVQWKW